MNAEEPADLTSPWDAEEKPDLTRRSNAVTLFVFLPLLVVLIGVISVLYVTHTTARVQGPSMEPTLVNDDIVLVTRGYDRPLRGDIIVMDGPEHPQVTPGAVLVKRVIAVAGDTVEVRAGRAYVNGQPERGSYTVFVADMDIELDPGVVPEGQVFVLGDNRPVSEDSRIFGPADIGLVQGRVVAILSPFGRMSLVD